MLLLPSLDSRSFDQLVDEARRQIPRLAPDWTDHNASDPGITVIELLAWVTETVLYRFDRVPPELRRAFLRLLGFPPLPAQVAQAVVTLRLAAPGPVLPLPAGLQLGGDGSPAIFETVTDLNVSPALLTALLAVAADGRVSELAQGQSAPDLAPFGQAPEVGAAFCLGFDQPLAPVGTRIDLYVWTPAPEADAATRAVLQADALAVPADCPRPDWRLHYGVRTVWEYFATGDRWLPLANVEDETRALTLSGPVRFTAPPTAGPDAHAMGGPRPGLFFIRCRLESGSYDRPPLLARIAHNAVAVTNSSELPPEDLASSSRGWAEETYRLAERPVVPGSTRLEVVTSSGTDSGWREVLDFDRSGPWDTHYVLDAAAGELRFGNGRKGRPLPAEARLRVSYRLGGGDGGNLAAGKLDQWLDNAHNAALVGAWSTLAAGVLIEQPAASFGGAGAETPDDAQARAVVALELPDKAVTGGDFERLARATPGTPVARAWALPEFHPALPGVRAAGSAGLVIIPDGPGPAPVATSALLRTIARYLEPRRLVTTELHVLPATYRTVAVDAVLHLERTAGAASVLPVARAVLDAFLHPLTGGPEGGGWPSGRAVYKAEIEALLAALDGVAAVTEVVLQAGDPPREFCDAAPLCPHELVRAGEHRLLDAAAPMTSPLTGSPADGCC